MKIQDKINTIETSGLSDTSSFSIKASPHAFHILSSGLYSNKIRAVIRELSCNAVDAHTDAKTAQPIEIKLPNELDKQFYVKDYGTGLTHEQVMKLYTTYFESTKQDSNAFIGGLGVGSKSPFAYTDSFTVESRQNGKIRLYAAYLDEHNMPAISKMSEADTEEPNGLTIGFPVSPSDFKEFAKEAEDLFKSFRQTPVIKGQILKIKQPNLNKLQKLTDTVYSINNQDSFPWVNRIRMGNVVYPLNIQKIFQDNKWLKWMLVKNGIFIDAEIGTYAVAASREQLQYDPVTIKKIKNDMALFYNAWLDEAKKFTTTISSFSNEYEQKYEIRKWLVKKGLDDDFFDNSYYDNDDDSSEYEDYSISVEEILTALKQKHQLDIPNVDESEFIALNTKHINIRSGYSRINSNLSLKTLSKGPSTDINLSYTIHTNIIVIDKPTNKDTLHTYIKNQTKERFDNTNSANRIDADSSGFFIIISPKKDSPPEEVKKEIEELKSKTGINTVTLSSTIPVVKTVKPTGVGPKKTPVTHIPGNLVYDSTKQSWISSSQNTPLEKTDTFVWMPLNRKTSEYNGKELDHNTYGQLQQTLSALHALEKELGIKTTKIYAIHPKNEERLKEFPNALLLDDYVKQLLATKKLDTILNTKTNLSVVKNDMYTQSREKENLEELSVMLKTAPVGKQLKKLLDEVNLETNLTRLCLSMNAFSKLDLGNMSSKKIKEIDYEKIHSSIKKRYPLLDDDFVQRYDLTPKLKREFSEYVAWKDSTIPDPLEI